MLNPTHLHSVADVVAAGVSSPAGLVLALALACLATFGLATVRRNQVWRLKQRLHESALAIDRIVDELHQRALEAELARTDAVFALDQLGESEARYRLLTERSTDIILRYADDGLIEFVSPSVRQLGYSAAVIVGRNIAEFTHPDDQDSRRNGSPHDMRLRRSDGEWVWMEGAPSPILDDDGVSHGVVTVLRDVTARRAMEDALQRKQAEAEGAVRAKSDFLANMTHELRTPLNAIIGFSKLLKESSDLAPLHARYVGIIADASDSLLGVVNDVLEFSKLEAGAVELDLHPFDAAEMIASSVSLLKGLAQAKNLTLTAHISSPGGLLLGDGPRLRQVLLNFISNAIKFTARGGVEVMVVQTTEGDQRRLRVGVKDSGIGVPADQVEAIFGRFTQADASVSRRYGGTGLGLAISKRIIDAMGGEIGVYSRINEGSTFWFEVPMPAAGAVDYAPQPDAVVMTQRLRLLAVDDNAINRELICALLAPFDCDIEVACDGVEAVEAASRSTFDMILMDVQMPNMDGLTATQRIRASADPAARRVPIIAMTANVLPEQVARCLDAGMDAHLGKPIDPHALLEALERFAPPEEEAQAPLYDQARTG